MNEYPGHQSILILNYCHIHHNAALVDLVNAAGDFMMYTHLFNTYLCHAPITVKAFLHRYRYEICSDDNPEMALMEACGCVTAEMAQAWFKHAGYVWND
jgi:hypothetical protein